MTNRGTNVVAFALGALAGGVTALLLAPRAGAETRRKINESAHDLYERGEKRVENVTGAARVRIDAVKEGLAEGRHAYREEMKKQREATKVTVGAD
jgi:gas vesicle protein